MSDVPILCFHPPTPPTPIKQSWRTPPTTPPTPPATPPLTRPPPPSLQPDAPSDALDQMDVDGNEHSPLRSPALKSSAFADGSVSELGMCSDYSDAQAQTSDDFPSSWQSDTSTPSLAAAREGWIVAQSRRASASARGEFKIPKHEQDWSAAETYVATLEDSLMALYRCLEDMEIAGSGLTGVDEKTGCDGR